MFAKYWASVGPASLVMASIHSALVSTSCGRYWHAVGTGMYPAIPNYSHCVEFGRTDRHFPTAGCVKKTVTPPTDKTRGEYVGSAS